MREQMGVLRLHTFAFPDKHRSLLLSRASVLFSNMFSIGETRHISPSGISTAFQTVSNPAYPRFKSHSGYALRHLAVSHTRRAAPARLKPDAKNATIRSGQGDWNAHTAIAIITTAMLPAMS